eukprot:gene26839-32437_t
MTSPPFSCFSKELKHGRDFVIENEEDFLAVLRMESAERIRDQLFPRAADIDYKVNKIAIYERRALQGLQRHSLCFQPPWHLANCAVVAAQGWRSGVGRRRKAGFWKTAGDDDDARQSVLCADEVGETDAMDNGDVAKAVDRSDPVKEAADNQEAVMLPWVSFPCSTLHEVLPVTEGICMVLQVDLITITEDEYELFDEENDEEDDEEDEGEVDEEDDLPHGVLVSRFIEGGGRRVSKKDHQLRCADEHLKALVSAVAQDKRPAYALPLFSVYSQSSIQPHAAGADSHEDLQRLENEYGSRNAKHKVWQVNYVAEAYVRDLRSPEGYRFAERKMAPMAETGDAIAMDKMSIDEMDGIDSEAQIETLEKVVYHETLLLDAKLMRTEDYVEYAGNESSPAKHEYFTCAMILRKLDTVVIAGGVKQLQQ